MELKSLEIKGGNIILVGNCPACGKAVARFWDLEE